MAGSWADVPSRKIAYHNDGTVVVGRYPLGGSPYERYYEWSAANVDQLNNFDHSSIAESWSTSVLAIGDITSSVTGRHVQSAWIFPEPRDIYGAIATVSKGYSSSDYGVLLVETSVDTTNGFDGTWVTQVTWLAASTLLMDPYIEAWRSAIESFTATAVRAVRVHGYVTNTTGGSPVTWRTFYIFGDIAAGETPDRILFINNETGLEFVKPMDWGDVPRGTTLDWDIYLLNNSTTLGANTMTLDFTALYGTADTWFTISDSGGAFATTADITSIAAAARYPAADVFTVRLAVPDAEPLAMYEAILELSPAASWTVVFIQGTGTVTGALTVT